jgi:hypothetical protein
MSLNKIILDNFNTVLAVNGVDVTYQRGNDTVTVKAVIGITNFRIDTDYGISEHIESRDYLIKASDLIINGESILPKKLDKIKQTIANQTITYEPLAPGDEPLFIWHDTARQVLRIHTKQVATN